jgi:uncharacterized membrane protein
MADDGSVIIGSKSGRGFRWSLNSGLEFLFNEESEPGFTPRSISQDGQKIAGEIFAGSSVASLWTFGQELQVLGPPAPESTLVEDISLDGSVIVGRGNGISSFDNSYVWTSQGGFFSIEEYFLQSGMDIAGWVIESAQAISADGNVIAGYGKYNGVTQAFVASVPEPSSLSLLLAGGAVLMVGRRRR